jgi:hypothetical protein
MFPDSTAFCSTTGWSLGYDKRQDESEWPKRDAKQKPPTAIPALVRGDDSGNDPEQ